jgi:hypothetical protein
MKTANWPASSLARIISWLTRGEIPVDGVTCLEPRAPHHDESLGSELDRCIREAEAAGIKVRTPVRWGNFR